MLQKKVFKELTTVLGSFCSFIVFAASLLLVVGSTDCSICQVFFIVFNFIQNYSEVAFFGKSYCFAKFVQESRNFLFSKLFPDRNTDLNIEGRLRMSTKICLVIHDFLFSFFLSSGYVFQGHMHIYSFLNYRAKSIEGVVKIVYRKGGEICKIIQ